MEIMNSVNSILLLITIAELTLGLCAWLCPQCLRWLAAHLLTRADIIDLSRGETKRRLQYWLDELVVAPERLGKDAHPELPSIQTLARP
jgi:hypothetical protein